MYLSLVALSWFPADKERDPVTYVKRGATVEEDLINPIEVDSVAHDADWVVEYSYESLTSSIKGVESFIRRTFHPAPHCKISKPWLVKDRDVKENQHIVIRLYLKYIEDDYVEKVA